MQYFYDFLSRVISNEFQFRYGLSEGSPDESGIKQDVQAGLDWVLAQDDIDKSNMYLFGQSIGGAVAINLAARNPKVFKGLILENSFTQMSDVIPNVIPALKYLTFLCHQKWASIGDLKTLITENDSIKILFLTGLKVTPSSFNPFACLG